MKFSKVIFSKLLLFGLLVLGSVSCQKGVEAPKEEINIDGSARKGDWLDLNEKRGGHIIAKHVEKSPKWLKGRLLKEPNIAFASSFRSNYVTRKNLSQWLENAAKWGLEEVANIKNPGVGRQFAFQRTVGKGNLGVMGRFLRRGYYEEVTSKIATIILAYSVTGWYVLTAYPDVFQNGMPRMKY